MITSAHCINPTLILVRLGAQDLSKSVETGAQDFRIKRSIVNDHFDLQSIANDIALIELNGEAPSNGELRSPYFLLLNTLNPLLLYLSQITYAPFAFRNLLAFSARMLLLA